MCSKLFQIYQKRTPTFLAEVVIVVGALLMVVKEREVQCGIQGMLEQFYYIVLLVSTV